VKDIKRHLFILFFFVILIFNLERLDFQDVSIVNFRPYFYFLIIVNLLLMLVWPPLQKTPVYILLSLWGAIYISLWLYFSRGRALTENVQITVLEFLFLEATVWLLHSLVDKVGKTELMVNTLVLGIFPGRVMTMEAAAVWIKNEMNRGRRHNRPLSVVVLDPQNLDLDADSALLRQFQRDVLKQFVLARLGQIISDQVRQTDMIIRGEDDKFIVLMPDTDKGSSSITTARILNEIQARSGSSVRFGIASFPQDALTFEELVHRATVNLSSPGDMVPEISPAVTFSSSVASSNEKVSSKS
jgi:GGDEF domain-containing protein